MEKQLVLSGFVLYLKMVHIGSYFAVLLSAVVLIIPPKTEVFTPLSNSEQGDKEQVVHSINQPRKVNQLIPSIIIPVTMDILMTSTITPGKAAIPIISQKRSGLLAIKPASHTTTMGTTGFIFPDFSSVFNVYDTIFTILIQIILPFFMWPCVIQVFIRFKFRMFELLHESTSTITPGKAAIPIISQKRSGLLAIKPASHTTTMDGPIRSGLLDQLLPSNRRLDKTETSTKNARTICPRRRVLKYRLQFRLRKCPHPSD
jgi:hypothetical protein